MAKTVWSETIKGNAQNYNWNAQFSKELGYVRIMQKQDDGTLEVILLTPTQVDALIRFVKPKKRAPRTAEATK